MKRLTLIALMVAIVVSLAGYRTVYNVRFMGLNVARITIDHDKQYRIILAEIKSLLADQLFPSLDNTYLIHYEGLYLPRTYTRQINQDSVKDVVVTNYDRTSRIATQTRKSEREASVYPIRSDIRDYFSLFTYLCETRGDGGTYYIDGNSTLWQTSVKRIGDEQLKTKTGTHQTVRYEMRFTNLSGIKPPYVDMVTFNTLNESSAVNFWVDSQGIPVRAHVKRNLLHMTWEMVSHTP